MAAQFRNIDRPKAAQVVSVTFEMVLTRDDTAGPPDKMQDGYWPSLDPKDCGYIGDGKTDADLKREHAKQQRRLTRWQNDGWHYVGVIARANVSVPIGGDSFSLYTIDSPGLWGIESDAGKYLKEVYSEQLDELKAQLAAMGAAFQAFATPAKESDVDTVRADLLAALVGLRTQVKAHVKMNVKQHYSLMVADVAAEKAIAKAGAGND